MSMSKRRMSKRSAVLLAAEIAENPKTPAPERMKALLFIERNSSATWKRNRRREPEEIVSSMVKTIEMNERRKLLEAIEAEQDKGKLQ